MAKILIVEDDPLMARMYQKTFTFEQYEVEVANDGEAGLEKAKTTNPNMILLDIMMPKMNGFEVLERLKSDTTTKNVPVVMLTNLAGEQDAEKALAMGAVKYFIKSEYDPKQIVDMVKQILGNTAPNTNPNPVTS